jgi:hypothetical protein
VDFLLCDSIIMRPLAGIELDDRSHERPDRRTRDELVGEVFANAGLPLVRIPAKLSYVRAEVEQSLAAFLSTETPAAKTSEPTAAEQAPAATAEPSCPKCGSKMVLRIAKSGGNAGGQFWGCSAFPRCRSILPVTVE